MTHIDPAIIEQALPYFEKRDTLAKLLKHAGVKKHAREYVAEVLIDAGVIDLEELDRRRGEEEDAIEAVRASGPIEAEWMHKRAWWNYTPGEVVGFDENAKKVLFQGPNPRARWLPVSWLTHEEPEPTAEEFLNT